MYSPGSDEGRLEDFPSKVLSRTEWSTDKERFDTAIRAWLDNNVSRRSRGEKHPVLDFLFEYYSFRPSHLKRWSPGIGVALLDVHTGEFKLDRAYYQSNILWIPAATMPSQRWAYVKWGYNFLLCTAERAPRFNCFGLHEWAMVYKTKEVRHAVALRLASEEIDEFLESQQVCCSHYDAFRFFTPEARPLNRLAPTREAQPLLDQPGCIHVTMDLYRFAYKLYPWCSSSLILEALEVARAAREIDMRASPYDLSGYGLRAIEIEKPEGRREYADLQRALFERAQPVRVKLLSLYRELLTSTPINDQLSPRD